ncbi:MAG TPA: hypothetical protein VJ302_16510, partial [Blastocatellia bacterium]|nr:hypothetical protein [Blastocatellia bacterium]
MTTEAPKIDPRTARNIAEEVQRLLKVYAPAWNEVDASGQAAGMSGALIGIFSRFAEIIIQRLNRAPQKNFLAFLDLLGGALLPPQPARVPLTFSLAAGSPVDGIVPAGTRVAAPPGEGETEPVLYETERQLVVTAAQLDALFVLDPEQDLYADLGALLTAPVADGRPLFEGDPERPIDHIFYLGDLDFFNLAHLSQVQLKLSFDRAVADELEIRWERRDAAGWTEIETLADITDDKLRTFDFGGLPTIDPSRVAGVESRWVRGRLLTPITLSPVEREGRVRAERLPTITACELTGEIGAEVAVERSFTNQFAIDPSTIFAPFGEKPKLGDAWLIGQREAFSQAGAGITLKLHIANEVQTDGKPKLTWEFWDGKSWQALKPTAGTPQAGQVQDNTADLTKSGDAEVKLQLPGPSVARELNGVSSSWLRVRLTGGNYGQEARYEKRVINGSEGFVVVEAPSFKPPLISSMTISYAGTVSADRIVLRAENDFVFESPANGRLKPFRPADEREPTFYLGVTLPPGSRPPR